MTLFRGFWFGTPQGARVMKQSENRYMEYCSSDAEDVWVWKKHVDYERWSLNVELGTFALCVNFILDQRIFISIQEVSDSQTWSPCGPTGAHYCHHETDIRQDQKLHIHNAKTKSRFVSPCFCVIDLIQDQLLMLNGHDDMKVGSSQWKHQWIDCFSPNSPELSV